MLCGDQGQNWRKRDSILARVNSNNDVGFAGVRRSILLLINHRKIIGTNIGEFSASVGQFIVIFSDFMQIISSKGPGNYSDST